MRTPAPKLIVLALAVLALALVPAALAAKGSGGGKGGGGGKPGGGGSTATGSFSLVLLNSTDGRPHYGQNVTFNVTSTASQPWVNLVCYQGGDWVVNQHVGFYAGYPWSQVFPLSSYKWPGGGANCNARLYDGSNNATLATMSFDVLA
jgi:hypothetical protein